jgi:catechol 2,3-dioxygenase-like lactoylglutathione lyase family enzyme
MKLKSAAGYACFVQDIDKTAEFYEALGLQIKERSANRLIVYLNWYRIDFVKVTPLDDAKFQSEAELPNKGAGLYLYFSVDNVDETYDEMITKGLQPSSKPTDQPWGNREFVIRDPDGYKLVIFKRKTAKNPLD